MKKIICIAALLCLCALALFGCSQFDEDYVYDGHSLIGKWCEQDYEDDYYISYEFFEGGKIEMKEYYYGIEFSCVEGVYSASGHEIIIDVMGFNGTQKHYQHKFSMNDDGDELVIVYLNEDDQMTEEEMILVPYDVDFNEDNSSLVGSWQFEDSPGEYWTFNKDYTGDISLVAGDYTQRQCKLYYSVNGDYLYMAYEFVEGVKQNLVEFEYEVDKDTLTLWGEINGTEVEYTLERK